MKATLVGRFFFAWLKKVTHNPSNQRSSVQEGLLKIQEELWGGGVLALRSPYIQGTLALGPVILTPTARTREALWADLGSPSLNRRRVIWQFFQGWVTEEKQNKTKLFSHSCSYHITSVRRSGLLPQFPCTELHFLTLNSPHPALLQGWLSYALFLDSGWHQAGLSHHSEPYSRSTFCCLDSCYHTHCTHHSQACLSSGHQDMCLPTSRQALPGHTPVLPDQGLLLFPARM